MREDAGGDEMKRRRLGREDKRLKRELEDKYQELMARPEKVPDNWDIPASEWKYDEDEDILEAQDSD
jgi:hypothetical protein